MLVLEDAWSQILDLLEHKENYVSIHVSLMLFQRL